MKVTPGHMIWNRDAAEERPVECWEVIGVEGEASPIQNQAITNQPATQAAPDSTARALELLDGKTMNDWFAVVFTDPVVKANTELVNNIINGGFIPPLEAAGIITKDEAGVYHKKA